MIHCLIFCFGFVIIFALCHFAFAPFEFVFLSDPSPIIGYACHSLTHSLTNSLTNCRLVNLIDVTLACEDANSKLVDVVTVSVVDVDERVGNSLVERF